LRPAATLALRRVAERVSAMLEASVEPVSLLHSSKVDPAKLDGLPAQTFERALRLGGEAGELEYLVLPFFLGPSRALTEYIPERVGRLRERFPQLNVTLARTLVDIAEDDKTVAAMLRDRVRAVARENGLDRPPLLLVDHGSPEPAVNAIREHVGAQLASALGDSVAAFSTCSMERREGPAYAFNEPLLETILRDPRFAGQSVVLAQLFLNPGRHAGENGDIAQICAEAEAADPALRIYRTELLGSHPRMPELLARRFREAWPVAVARAS